MSRKTVLCVDDEVHILNALKRLLRKEEYDLLTASGGPEGLDILEKQSVDLVISDQRMPRMTGAEFLQKVKERHPQTVRVVLSGYADAAMMLDAINKGEILRFLPKPWNDEELKTAIRQCLEHHDVAQQSRTLMEQIGQQNEDLRRLNEGLEALVEERTHSLRLSQAILEELPVPVVGIGPQGTLVLANRKLRETFPHLAETPPNTDMRRVFPPEVVANLERWLTGDRPGDPPPFDWQGRQTRLHVEPVGEDDTLRGCVLIVVPDPP